MSLRVQDPGLLTTVQDLGRYGYSHLGISPGGAADSLAMRIANLLVGNPENAATLEMTLAGATLEFDEESIVALSGGECDCRINGDTAPMWQAMRVPAGGILTCGAMKTGAGLYLGIEGGLDVQPIRDSRSWTAPLRIWQDTLGDSRAAGCAKAICSACGEVPIRVCQRRSLERSKRYILASRFASRVVHSTTGLVSKPLANFSLALTP